MHRGRVGAGEGNESGSGPAGEQRAVIHGSFERRVRSWVRPLRDLEIALRRRPESMIPGCTTATGPSSTHVTRAPPQAHPKPAAWSAARRATAREGRRPVGGGRPRDADGQCRAGRVPRRQLGRSTSITVHQAAERGGAPNPRLLVLRSVLDVAVRPQGSSSSWTARSRSSSSTKSWIAQLKSEGMPL